MRQLEEDRRMYTLHDLVAGCKCARKSYDIEHEHLQHFRRWKCQCVSSLLWSVWYGSSRSVLRSS